MGVSFNTTHEMLVMAKRNLSHDEWDYINGAAESETSLRRNRQAIDSLAFRPRILRDVRNIDISTKLLGSHLKMPVVLAPIGGLQRMTKNAANDVDTAAAACGVMNFISTVTDPSIEESPPIRRITRSTRSMCVAMTNGSASSCVALSRLVIGAWR